VTADPATAQPHPGAVLPSMLFVDERGGGLRVTCHAERDLVVLSLWREDRCMGTFRMAVADVPRLTGFLRDHLAACAQRSSSQTITRNPSTAAASVSSRKGTPTAR
jgi:hypothetical protein